MRPDPRGLRLCRAKDLVGRLAGYNGLTGGTAIDYVVVRNISSSACVLVGPPSFAAFDRAGRPVRLVPSSLDGDFTHNARRVALLARPAREAWREAEIPFSVSGLTDAGQPCPPNGSVDFGRVQVSLPGTGRVSVRVPSGNEGGPLGTCEGRFRVGAFIAPDA